MKQRFQDKGARVVYSDRQALVFTEREQNLKKKKSRKRLPYHIENNQNVKENELRSPKHFTLLEKPGCC